MALSWSYSNMATGCLVSLRFVILASGARAQKIAAELVAAGYVPRRVHTPSAVHDEIVGDTVLILDLLMLGAMTPEQIEQLRVDRASRWLRIVVLTGSGTASLSDLGVPVDEAAPAASPPAVLAAVFRLMIEKLGMQGAASAAVAATLQLGTQVLPGTVQILADGELLFVCKRAPENAATGSLNVPSATGRIMRTGVAVLGASATGPSRFEVRLKPSAPGAGSAVELLESLSEAPSSDPKRQRRVLIVDDSELLNRIVKVILTDAGYEVKCQTSPFGTCASIKRDQPDVVLIDYNMPGLRGDTIIDMVRRAGFKTPMVLYSNAPESTLRDAATRSGADAYIQKGVDPARLVDKLDAVLRNIESGC